MHSATLRRDYAGHVGRFCGKIAVAATRQNHAFVLLKVTFVRYLMEREENSSHAIEQFVYFRFYYRVC